MRLLDVAVDPYGYVTLRNAADLAIDGYACGCWPRGRPTKDIDGMIRGDIDSSLPLATMHYGCRGPVCIDPPGRFQRSYLNHSVYYAVLYFELGGDPGEREGLAWAQRHSCQIVQQSLAIPVERSIDGVHSLPHVEVADSQLVKYSIALKPLGELCHAAMR